MVSFSQCYKSIVKIKMRAGSVVWLVVIILRFFFVNWTLSTEIIPERAEVYYCNEKYLTNASAYIKRYSRRSPYYFNLEGTVMDYFGDNVSLHGTFYEFLHNEYKRGFVEIEVKMCDLVNKRPWNFLVGDSLVAHGFECPLRPATYRVQNITVSMENFPYVWPFEKIMFQGYAKFVRTQEIIVRARFYATFKQKPPKGK